MGVVSPGMGLKSSITGDDLDIARSGDAFHVSSYFTILNSGTNYFQIKTDSRTIVILGYEMVTNTQPVRFTTLEEPTVTNGTTALAARNLNRQATTAATVLLYSDPTSISGGTTLVDHIVPSGGNKSGGAITNADVWTLKKETSYVIKLENKGNNDTICAFNMTWLEI